MKNIPNATLSIHGPADKIEVKTFQTFTLVRFVSGNIETEYYLRPEETDTFAEMLEDAQTEVYQSWFDRKDGKVLD